MKNKKGVEFGFQERKIKFKIKNYMKNKKETTTYKIQIE